MNDPDLKLDQPFSEIESNPRNHKHFAWPLILTVAIFGVTAVQYRSPESKIDFSFVQEDTPCTGIAGSKARLCYVSYVQPISPFGDSDDNLHECATFAPIHGNMTSYNVTACKNLLWPMPSSYKAGGTSNRQLSSAVTFRVSGNAKGSSILRTAISRYSSLIYSHGEVDAKTSYGLISTIQLTVSDASEEYPQMDTDVSYELQVPSTGDVVLYAETIYGAMYGLETLSQLVSFDPEPESYVIDKAPIRIRDSPRFKYRGLMVDLARHFIPIKFLEQVVDTMAYSKLNVLHLHLSDQESFPLKSTMFPHLWDSAFSKGERYTSREMRQLVKYAHMRGVSVMPEFDSPSHSKAMCMGVPDMVCMSECSYNDNQPLRPLDVTFQYLHDLWSEVLRPMNNISEMFPFNIGHIGGDEVKTECWDEDNVTALWMKENGLNSTETYLYFVNRNVDIMRSHGRSSVVWNDAFDDFTTEVDPSAILMFWTDLDNGKYFKMAAKNNRKIIAATAHPLYLSNSNDYSAKLAYEYDPCDCSNSANQDNCVNTTSECEMIIGLETAFWTSDYDASNLAVSLWPRAAAMAERAWSAQEFRYYTNETFYGSPSTTERLGKFRCSLMQRGVPVLPVTANWYHKYASNRPDVSGSCMSQ